MGVDARLMRPGSPWERQGRRQAEHEKRRVYYREVRQLAGIEPNPRGVAAIVAHLALPWTGLCMPVDGSDDAACDDYERGRMTLGELVPWLWRWSE